jgi:hypothetical protein
VRHARWCEARRTSAPQRSLPIKLNRSSWLALQNTPSFSIVHAIAKKRVRQLANVCGSCRSADSDTAARLLGPTQLVAATLKYSLNVCVTSYFTIAPLATAMGAGHLQAGRAEAAWLVPKRGGGGDMAAQVCNNVGFVVVDGPSECSVARAIAARQIVSERW